MLVVVIPFEIKKGADVCIYWQSTAQKGRKYERSDKFTTITSASDRDSGVDIQFSAGKGYTFTGFVCEDDSTLRLSMKDKKRVQSGNFTLALHDTLSPLKLQTSTDDLSIITNDTPDLACCIVTNSADDGRAKASAIAAMILALMDITPSSPRPNSVAGIRLATVGTLNDFFSGNNTLFDMIHPKEEIRTKTLASSPVGSRNVARVLTFAVDDAYNFVVKMKTKGALRSGTYKLSEFHERILLKASLPRGSHLNSYKGLIIRGFVPVSEPVVLSKSLRVHDGCMISLRRQ